MADLRYKVKVDTAGASSAIGGLKAKIGGLGTAFKALAVALVARELVTTIRQFQDLKQVLITIEGDATKAAKSFKLIKDFTKGTTFQLAEVTTAFITFKNAGLTPTTDFMKNIGNIAAGMKKNFDQVAQAVFNATTGEFEMLKQLGIKVKTEGDKLTVIMGNTTKVIANDGREIITLLNEIGETKFAGAIEAQSKTLSGAISNLDDNFRIFLNEIGEGGLTSALTDAVKSMQSAIASGNGFAKVLGGALGGAIRFITENIKILTVSFGLWLAAATIGKVIMIGGAFVSLAKGIRVAAVSMIALNSIMSKNIFIKVAQGLLLLGSVVAGYFALGGEAIAGTNKEMEALKKSLDEVETGGDIFGGKALTPQVDEKSLAAIKKSNLATKEMVASYKFANAETLNTLDLNRKMLGMNEEQVLLTQALAEHTDKYASQMRDLAKAKAEANALDAGPEKVARLKDLAEAEKELGFEYNKNTKSIIDKNKAQYQEIQNTRFLNFQLAEQSATLKKVRKIQDDTRRLTMTANEKKYDDIAIAARESAESQIESWAKAQNMMRSQVPVEEVKKAYEEAFRGVGALTRATQNDIDTSRKWSTGWKRAFNEYIEAASDASAKAERFFNKAVTGMEDLIVNFAKTGKFEWKGFVDSMLEDLFRSNLQTLMAQIFKGVGLGDVFGGGSTPTGSSNNPLYVVPVGGGGGGGLPSALGNIFGGGGKGSKGSGSGGGGGLGSILGSVGSVILGNGRTPDFNPNTTPSGGGIMGTVGNIVKSVGSGIGSVVSGIGKGLGSIFGGFFANGGNLPAGKFGIVGERGPEMISGPGTITPISGGSTNVVYNINAVDALSFKQMVARDPSFIYAVTEQGRKSAPLMRR